MSSNIPKKPQVNEGIVAHTINNSGQMAVGRGAKAIQRIEQVAAGQSDNTLLTTLNELKDAINAHVEDEKKRDETLEMLASVAEELKKEKPNTTMASTLLKGLEESVSSITNIAVKLAPFIMAARATLGM